MSDIKFGHGFAWRFKRSGKRQNIDTLQEALTAQASCGPCGCDDCYGHWTQLNAETGELMAMWITGTGPYTVNVDLYDNALPILKALKAAR